MIIDVSEDLRVDYLPKNLLTEDSRQLVGSWKTASSSFSLEFDELVDSSPDKL